MCGRGNQSEVAPTFSRINVSARSVHPSITCHCVASARLFRATPGRALAGSTHALADSWRGPPLFEHAWSAAVADTRSLGKRFTYLNVSFLDARPDGHVATSMRYSSSTGRFGNRQKVEFPIDCLHYCYPGPSDYLALSLYNLLLNNPARYG